MKGQEERKIMTEEIMAKNFPNMIKNINLHIPGSSTNSKEDLLRYTHLTQSQTAERQRQRES